MSNENYLNKIKDLPESVKQFGGLVLIILIIFFSFSFLNIMFGGGVRGPDGEEQVVDRVGHVLRLGRIGLQAGEDRVAGWGG